MLLYTDRVMVDYMLTLQKRRIIKLREEIMQLKNRPDPVSDVPPKTVIQVVAQKSRISLDAPVNEWGPTHFIKYYQQKYKEKYKQMRKFSADEWKAGALRIHYFLERHSDELTKETYKQFINWIFRKVATRRFIPMIGNLVSDSHFYQWRDSKKRIQSFTNGFTKDIKDVDPDNISMTDINNRMKKLGV